MSSTPAEILRSMRLHVKKGTTPEWVNDDVIRAVVVELRGNGSRRWSEVRDITVCRHGDWRYTCNGCTDEMNDRYELAQMRAAGEAQEARAMAIADGLSESGTISGSIDDVPFWHPGERQIYANARGLTNPNISMAEEMEIEDDQKHAFD